MGTGQICMKTFFHETSNMPKGTLLHKNFLHEETFAQKVFFEREKNI